MTVLNDFATSFSRAARGFSSLVFFSGCLRDFHDDRRGSYTIMAAMALPTLVGFAGLGTEVGIWLRSHQTAQAAADSAAISAATARYRQGNAADTTTQARAVASAHGLTHGAGGVTVTVASPPTTGAYTGNANAVQVTIVQPQTRFFSKIFGSNAYQVRARSVAVLNGAGAACVLALNASASGAIKNQGTSDITLNGCSLFTNSSSASAMTVVGNATVSALSVGAVGGISGENKITATQGIQTGQASLADPYAGVPLPAFSGCDQNNAKAKNNVTLSPGVYCGGLDVNAGANVTLQAGTYIMDRGSFKVNGGATVSGDGVTIVYTSSTGSNYATATINGGATLNLTAPTTGNMAGFVMYGDQNMPVGSQFTFNGGSTQNFEGAVYLPKADIKYAGGAEGMDGCTQVIADTITFTGNANIAVNCSQTGISAIGGATAMLVE